MRLALAVLVLLVAAPAAGAAEPRPRLVTFGHSYVTGVNPDKRVPAWPALVGAYLQLPVLNLGVDGAQSLRTAQTVLATPLRRSDVVVIETTLNDVGRRGLAGLPRFRQNLTAMLRHAAAAKTFVALDPAIRDWWRAPFAAGGPAVLDAYNRSARRIALREGAGVVPLPTGWDPKVHISSDGIHPNWIGTLVVALHVYVAIKQRP